MSSADEVLRMLQSSDTFHLSPHHRRSSAAAAPTTHTTHTTIPTDERRSVLKSSAFNSLFQLSEEYTCDADRLDKFQVEEGINRRRHSLFEQRPIAATVGEGNGAPSALVPAMGNERRSSAAASLLPTNEAPQQQQEARHTAVDIVIIEAPLGQGQSQELSDQSPQPHHSSDEEEEEEDNEGWLLTLRAQQSKAAQRRRRSSVTFSSVLEEEEGGEEGKELYLDHPPPPSPSSYAEEEEPVGRKLTMDEDAMLPPKRRSQSLFPSAETSAFFSAFRHRGSLGTTSKEEPGPSTSHSHSQSAAATATAAAGGAMKALRKKARNLLLSSGVKQLGHQHHRSFHNIRSDSVDSGFSCASGSSYTSSSCSDEMEDGQGPVGRSISMGVGGGMGPGGRGRSASLADGGSGIGAPDLGDYPAWLRSVKRLVALTKELKTLGETGEEGKRKASIVEEIVGSRQTENVKKFIRHNDWPVSHEIRADLWRVLCHSKDFDSNKLLYLQQLEELTKSGGGD